MPLPYSTSAGGNRRPMALFQFNRRIVHLLLLGLFCLLSSSRRGTTGEAFLVTSFALATTTTTTTNSQKSPVLQSIPSGGGSSREKETVELEQQHRWPFLSSISNGVSSNYHLLWSPGVWKKVAISTLTLFLAHGVGKLFLLADFVEDAMMEGSAPSKAIFPLIRSLATNVVLPLLASACCFLQLIMNVFALGCAGFNTVLGPIRPYFISLLIYLTVISRTTNPGKHWVATSLLRWSMAILPEGVDLWNNRRKQYQQQTQEHDHDATKKPLDTSIESNGVLPLKTATVQLEIPTMGCVACINSVDKALLEVENVLFASSSLKPLGIKGGQAEVWIAADTEEEINRLVRTLAEVVAEAGFPGGTVESVKIRENQDKIS